MPSRSSSDNHHHNNRNPNNFRGGFSGGGHNQRHHFNSPPPNHPAGGGGFRPMGGGSGFGGGGVGGGHPIPISGQKRGFTSSGRGGSPTDNTDGGGFAKLFVGSVPRTATEEEIRPLFEEHGDVIEVALIKDKRTGQQQGCCFIKYGTSEDADRAIRALHNQYTLPGGVGPIQVRYADGERERLGAVEHKLFVGSMNRHATEKEIEEIFAPYGRVEDVYIMRDELKQSRGCGFVKFSHRDMAAAAINALNGTYLMRGCDQPLTVRFADPKRPRVGESRGAPAFGGPGFGPRSQVTSGFRPGPNLGDPMGGRGPRNAWHPMSPQGVGPTSDTSAHGFGGQLVTRGGVTPALSATSGPLGGFGGPTNGSLPGLAVLPSSISQQSFNPSLSQVPSVGQQISPLQKPLQSPPDLLPPLQLQPQHTPVSYSQTSQASTQQLGQLHIPNFAVRPSLSQALPSPHLFGSSGPVSVSQPQVQQSASSATTQLIPLNLRQGVSATAGQQQLPVPAIQQQQLLQPPQQSQSQLAQVLSQQTQALQASFQSSQQAFSQLQQQLHMMQQSGQNLSQQPSSQATKQQSPWTGSIQQGQTVASTLATAAAVPAPSTTSAAPAATVNTQAGPLTCNWTEHTSPEGYKYYYNSVTSESRWEKPEELTLFEQQQQQKLQHQQKPSIQQLQSQTQTQSHPQVLSTQQVSQTQHIQIQSQIRHQQQLQLQQPSLSSSELGYAQSQVSASSDPTRFHQGMQATQEWMWKNKPTDRQNSSTSIDPKALDPLLLCMIYSADPCLDPSPNMRISLILINDAPIRNGSGAFLYWHLKQQGWQKRVAENAYKSRMGGSWWCLCEQMAKFSLSKAGMLRIGGHPIHIFYHSFDAAFSLASIMHSSLSNQSASQSGNKSGSGSAGAADYKLFLVLKYLRSGSARFRSGSDTPIPRFRLLSSLIVVKKCGESIYH
ncbi:RNA recognition motif domain [Macleaya cordata]|uniref:Flowering time control protein FCA n=1 Tax=Macleaya cordata TaxID=56857 RepID=A0A200QSX9_MACCD|nr:RNA recognition motif domain [Macleaya cordata]